MKLMVDVLRYEPKAMYSYVVCGKVLEEPVAIGGGLAVVVIWNQDINVTWGALMPLAKKVKLGQQVCARSGYILNDPRAETHYSLHWLIPAKDVYALRRKRAVQVAASNEPLDEGRPPVFSQAGVLSNTRRSVYSGREIRAYVYRAVLAEDALGIGGGMYAVSAVSKIANPENEGKPGSLFSGAVTPRRYCKGEAVWVREGFLLQGNLCTGPEHAVRWVVSEAEAKKLIKGGELLTYQEAT